MGAAAGLKIGQSNKKKKQKRSPQRSQPPAHRAYSLRPGGRAPRKKINNLCVLSDLCGEILLGTASDLLQFHMSVPSGRKRPVKSNKKLKNVEHRTSNIQHRIMYSAYLKKTERSDSTLRHSIFDILRFCGSLLTVVSYKVSRLSTSVP